MARAEEDRRAGLRGHWEERRLLDRRKRAYSMFGKALHSDEQAPPNPTHLPKIALEEIISPAEIRILNEEETREQTTSASETTQKPRLL